MSWSEPRADVIQAHDGAPFAERRDERREDVAIDAALVELFGRRVGRRDDDATELKHPLEHALEHERVCDVDELHLVEADDGGFGVDGGGDRGEGVHAYASSGVEPAMHLGHELVEMDAARARGEAQWQGGVERVHQHRLTTADAAVEVDALGGEGEEAFARWEATSRSRSAWSWRSATACRASPSTRSPARTRRSNSPTGPSIEVASKPRASAPSSVCSAERKLVVASDPERRRAGDGTRRASPRSPRAHGHLPSTTGGAARDIDGKGRAMSRSSTRAAAATLPRRAILSALVRVWSRHRRRTERDMRRLHTR